MREWRDGLRDARGAVEALWVLLGDEERKGSFTAVEAVRLAGARADAADLLVDLSSLVFRLSGLSGRANKIVVDMID